jgi:hypothetical protein
MSRENCEAPSCNNNVCLNFKFEELVIVLLTITKVMFDHNFLFFMFNFQLFPTSCALILFIYLLLFKR